VSSSPPQMWAAPTVIVTAVLAYRQRHLALGAVAAAGVALMVWTPIPLMPEHHETSASLWRQLVGGSYLWWAVAVIAAAATVSASSTVRTRPTLDAAPVPAVS
jgi:alpha-1,2-mannosyltransferase